MVDYCFSYLIECVVAGSGSTVRLRYARCKISEGQRKVLLTRGSEQMEGGRRANRKWRLNGFLMLCWQQAGFHFPLLTQSTGAVGGYSMCHIFVQIVLSSTSCLLSPP